MPFFYFGERVAWRDGDGDTGLRGTIASPLQPAIDANGPLIHVRIVDAGDTGLSAGVTRPFYAQQLVEEEAA